LLYLGRNYQEAMESARNGSIFLFRNFHSNSIRRFRRRLTR